MSSGQHDFIVYHAIESVQMSLVEKFTLKDSRSVDQNVTIVARFHDRIPSACSDSMYIVVFVSTELHAFQ